MEDIARIRNKGVDHLMDFDIEALFSAIDELEQENMRLSAAASNRAKYTIGTTFTTRGKHPRTCTVTDVLTTVNSKGEVVRVRYVATHETMGQIVTDRDVCETTIAMGLIS